MERRIPIYLVEGQTRFEPWAKEDGPSLINPKSLKIDAYRRSDFDDLAMVYMSVFNAQNKRKYANIPNAILAWDEDPWTYESAADQLSEELSSDGRICFIARARNLVGRKITVGFILARPVGKNVLSEICGLEKIADDIFGLSGSSNNLLLWEDAGVANLKTRDGKYIRGVGKCLYKNMARAADKGRFISIGRTAPGSYAERVLPSVNFENSGIRDGKDSARYWLIRKPS